MVHTSEYRLRAGFPAQPEMQAFRERLCCKCVDKNALRSYIHTHMSLDLTGIKPSVLPAVSVAAILRLVGTESGAAKPIYPIWLFFFGFFF